MSGYCGRLGPDGRLLTDRHDTSASRTEGIGERQESILLAPSPINGDTPRDRREVAGPADEKEDPMALGNSPSSYAEVESMVLRLLTIARVPMTTPARLGVARVVGVVVAAWIGVAAPGSPQAAGQAATACSVLSAADIRTALGVATSGEGKAADIGVRHTCDWKLSSGADLRLAVFTSARAETLTSGPSSGPRAWEPVEGLGQKAGYRRYNFAATVAVEEVQVVLPERAFFVQVTGHPDQMPGRAGLIALARLAAGRLR